MITKKNLAPISFISGVGIILVVFGHCMPPRFVYPPEDSFAALIRIITAFIYTFHMPLFIFVSGYLYTHTNPPEKVRSYGTLMTGKAVRLLIPYLTLGSLVFLPKALLSKFAQHPVELTFAAFSETLVYPWRNSVVFYWFLPTLFLIFLAAPLLLKIVRMKMNLLPLFCLAGILVGANLLFPHRAEPSTIVNYTGVAHNILFFFCGIVAAEYIPITITVEHPTRPQQYVILGSALLFFILQMSLFIYAPLTSVTALLMALLGIATVYCLALLYQQERNKSFAAIAASAYQIFLLSWFFQEPWQIICGNFITASSPVLFFPSFLGGLFGPLIVVWLHQKLNLPGAVIIGLRKNKSS